MNNNIFQPDRFLQLLNKSLKENPKSWILSTAIFVGLPVLFLILNAINVGGSISLYDRIKIMQLFVCVAFVFSPFALYYNYNHPKKGLTHVMLPASITEKYIALQLTCIIFAPLAVLVLFGGMDSLLALIFPKIYGGYAVPNALADFLSWETFSEYFAFQQLFMFFNLLFVRRKIIKTLGVYVLAGIVFLAFLGIGVAVWDSHSSFTDTHNFNLEFKDRGIFEIYPDDHPIIIIFQVSRILWLIVLPIISAIGSYFVLKNKRY